jgi:predicted transposase YbfD/YdcC
MTSYIYKENNLLKTLNKSRLLVFFMLTPYIFNNIRRFNMDQNGFSISTHFASITDPRKYHIRHNLIDVITIAICAITCGAQNWVDVEQYGKSKYDWLKLFLQLPGGVPSHDTFGRLFSMLDPKQFRESFTCWWQSIRTLFKQNHIAIDGKTLRASYDNALGKGPIHMVSAWAVENGMVLGQVKTDEKSNEITAIPELIKQLELQNTIVTIDAMGCQKAIAKQIIDKKGDYVLSLKGNQSNLHEQIKLFFQDNFNKPSAFDRFESIDGDHGRIESRRYWASCDIDWLQGKEHWAGIKSITMVQRERDVDNKISAETSYYISSVDKDAQKIAHAIRSHWHIENSLHWVLDVSFNEDKCRVRKDHAPENVSILRHIVLNLLKQEKTSKGSIQTKRLKAAWENSYMLKILTS